ncbi:MAG: glycosyltransferase family 4 protein [Bacteroidetes bacterium]|nr:glycosyltransferase family 4 protein [Bacteroidota bacterium]
MKILMLLDRVFPPDIRVQNEALSLIKEGHEVHILSYNFSNKPKSELYKGITIHRFRISEQIAKKSLGLIHLIPVFKLIWQYEVISILKKHKFEAVHIHDLPLCFLTKKLKSKEVKVVADMHENYPYLVAEQKYMNTKIGRVIFSKQIWFKKEQIWLEFADEIVCVAEEMKKRLQNVISKDKNILVVPNTYSFHSFGQEQVENRELKERFKEKFIISYLGGFDEQRGINNLIKAFALMREQIPTAMLLLVGDGSIKGDLQELVRELKIEAITTFEGWQPSKYVDAYINISSVCIIPHIRSEQTDNSSPNKLFQYMYASKPVVVSNCISLERIIMESGCGLVYEDKNVNELADKLLYLYQNQRDAELMGQKGHDAVIKKYNWDVTVFPLLRIYMDIQNESLYKYQ